MAAAVARLWGPGVSSSSELDPVVGEKACEFMVTQYKKAQECAAELGGPTSNDPLTVDEINYAAR